MNRTSKISQPLFWGTLSFLLVFISVSEAVAQICVTPPSNLVSWWPGDGDATDIAGSNDGTPVNGATFGTGLVTSGNGQAFSFDGVDDVITIPHSPSLRPETGSFTLDAWIQTTAGVYHQFIVSQYECGLTCIGAVSEGSYFLFLDPSGVLNFWIRSSSAITHQVADTTFQKPLNDGAFHHVAGVRDVENLEFKVFVDGQLAGSIPLTATGTITDDDGTPDPVLIGAVRVAGGSAFEHLFNGLIDEVEYSNRALSATEIQAIFNAGSAGKCKMLADALNEAGLDLAYVPPSVLELLNDAADAGLLSTVVGTLPDDIPLAPGEAVVVGAGGTVTGNIIGDGSNTVVLGNGTTVNGNIEGVGVVFTGNAQVDGTTSLRELFDTANELSIAPGALVSFDGNVDVAMLDIGEGGAAAINGDLTFVGSAVLNMASDAMVGVNGNIICSAGMSANVDAGVEIRCDGNNECPALSGSGGLP